MKSKLLRILSLILILSSLISMLAVFAHAQNEDETTEGEEEEEENLFNLLTYRTFDEGWDWKNGFGQSQSGGSKNEIEYETALDGTNNYFWRFEVGSRGNDYTQLNYNLPTEIGAVLEFDIKSDDGISTVNSVVNLGVGEGDSNARMDYDVVIVKNGEVYFFNPGSCDYKGFAKAPDSTLPDDGTETPDDGTETPDDGTETPDDDVLVDDFEDQEGGTDETIEIDPKYTDPVFKLEDKWMTVKLVFDYTYEHEPIGENDDAETVSNKEFENYKWFRLYVWYGPADGSEELTLWTGEPIILKGTDMGNAKGRALNFFRFGCGGSTPADNMGLGVCFDNVKAYTGVNELVEITSDMGRGSNVDVNYSMTETIFGVSSSAGENAFASGLSMKVGVSHCYYGNKRHAIATDEDGNAYGAPIKIGETVMIPLYTVLDYLGYPSYLHPDGIYLDVSTGSSATYIVLGKNTATVGSETVYLSTAPCYVEDKNGYSYAAIALEDVEVLFPGYYGHYDEMGYMIINTVPDVEDDPETPENEEFIFLDRTANLNTMVNLMKKFIYDYATGDQIYEDVKENTNGFQHPYLFAHAEEIDRLHEEYVDLNTRMNAGEIEEGSEDYWMWVHYQRIVETGEGDYKRYALPSYAVEDTENNNVVYEYEYFVGLSADDATRLSWRRDVDGVYKWLPVAVRSTSYSLAQPYLTGTKPDGYDVGGRSDITSRTQFLERMTYAYVLTRDVKFLQCMYEVAIELGKWTHWGPGHFLNCADSSNDFAVYFDLAYTGYEELKAQGIKRPEACGGGDYEVSALAEILFRQGAHEGYLSTNKINEHVSLAVGTGGAYYSERNNNWNAVCTGGMGAACLALMGEFEVGTSAYNEITFTISDNIKTLTQYGMVQYAPDGSYIEGPGYWNYGTNQFFRLCAMLDSSAGTNYGLMDTWGIDTTCYYACHTESSDGRTFNFHDGAMSGQDTSYFFYVGNFFNDATLYDVRLKQINGNLKWAEFIDLIYYPRDIEINAGSIDLDYYSDNIDLFATRSGWDRGSLYASMIGGNNNVTHGQIDAGDFVYHNGGNVWVIDLGTENYNCDGFWPSATRYRFYVMKPEGNNTVAISSDAKTVPYGQVLDSIADAKTWGSNEYGAYVVYDMTNTLGKRSTKWLRGMMLTNDRKTTIIQDQITLDSMQTVWWFAHFSSDYVDDVEISKDGRTAYMKKSAGTNELGQPMYTTIRFSILSKNTTYKFQLMDAYTFIHNDKDASGKYVNPNYTYEKGYIATQGNMVPENDRSKYGKLAICSGTTLDFNIAVAIEMVDYFTIGNANEIDVGYEFTDMEKWTPTADLRGQIKDDDVVTIERRGIPSVSKHIVQPMAVADMFVKNGTAFNERFAEFYRAITDAYYAERMLGRDMPKGYETQLANLKSYREQFDAYRKEVDRLADVQTEFIYKLMGLK